jgi:hypothetical protein
LQAVLNRSPRRHAVKLQPTHRNHNTHLCSSLLRLPLPLQLCLPNTPRSLHRHPQLPQLPPSSKPGAISLMAFPYQTNLASSLVRTRLTKAMSTCVVFHRARRFATRIRTKSFSFLKRIDCAFGLSGLIELPFPRAGWTFGRNLGFFTTPDDRSLFGALQNPWMSCE